MLETEPDLTDRLFTTFDFSRGAIAAVSGGSDSTALLLLLKQHMDRNAPAARLLAVTVDHDLRAGSATEALAVAALCAERGIAHRTLMWSGSKPASGLPAAAREARYRLLAGLARSEGLGLIVTGHTADDQAETVLMRKSRDNKVGDGEVSQEGVNDSGRGLAGMAPATLYDWRTWIARPLLGMRRAALREALRQRNVGWIEDPTNTDARFERPRMRASLAGNQGERRIEEALAKAAEAAAGREEIGQRAAVLIGRIASTPAPGLIRLDGDFANCADSEAAVYALRILLATIGGMPFLADEARCRVLFARLRSGPLRATLSRTVVDARRTGIFLRREARNLPVAAPPVDNWLWDGRRRITLSNNADGLVIAPLGSAAAKRAALDEVAPQSLLRAALAVEPALWAGGECLGFAGGATALRSVSIAAAMAPFARFLPSFDLRPAAAVAILIGAPPLPAPPFRGHEGGAGWAKA
ncbi:tRNA lysidine(34) synthetase TilS [Mesorhizobium sp. ORM8.1]